MRDNHFLPRTKLVNREATILSLAEGKDALHIGMGGHIDDEIVTGDFIKHGLQDSLHYRLNITCKSLVGVDINETMIREMSKVVEGTYFVADITDNATSDSINRSFDMILFLDVIEHLDCFRGALENCRRMLRDGGVLVITAPNAYSFESGIKMLFGYESTHPEHTCYFSYMTIARLMRMNGFRVDEFYFTLQTINSYDSFFQRFGYGAMSVACYFMPQFASGILVVARASA